MIRFQATASHLGEHRGKHECIGVAHKRDRDRGIAAEFLFEAFGGLHSAESSTENQHMLRLLNRRGEFLLGAENPGNQGVAALDQDRDGCAVHDPTDQGGQMCTHLSRSPFGHRSGEQGIPITLMRPHKGMPIAAPDISRSTYPSRAGSIPNAKAAPRTNPSPTAIIRPGSADARKKAPIAPAAPPFRTLLANRFIAGEFKSQSL